ncbi:MAG: glycoside hydrolase family 38 C-terminal domain-containing protein, partial [Clostridia bacterium]
EADDYPTHRLANDRVEKVHTDIVLENAYLRATFDRTHGGLISLFDKEAQCERIAAGRPAGLHFVDTEHATSNAWNIGRHLTDTSLQAIQLSAKPGALRSQLTLTERIRASQAVTTVTLDADSHALAYTVEVEWNEIAKPDVPVPVLSFVCPLSAPADTYRMDIPAGSIDHTEIPADLPALSYDAACYGTRALSLVTDSKYGYRNVDHALSVTLINTAGFPDPDPERGRHHVRLFLAATAADAKTLKETAFSLTHPIVCCPATRHAGVWPLSGTFLQMEAASCVLCAVRLTSDGALLAQVYETCGVADHVTLRLPFVPTSSARVDLAGRMLSPLPILGQTVAFDVPAHGLFAVRIEGKALL